MIQRQKEKYGWEFLFLGANIDAAGEAARFGIRPENAVNYHADSRGTEAVYAAVSEAVMEARCSPKPLSGSWRKRVDADFNGRKK